MIACLDLDCFFVSAERLYKPYLRDRPVIIGGVSGRGVVSCASYEARKFGVKSAMPIAQARRLCPEGVYLPGNHRFYAEISRRVREVLEKYAPTVAPASIDEFFMDFSGCDYVYRTPRQAAGTARRAMRQELGLPASCGLATNRTLAKIACEMAKPDGLICVFAGAEEDFLSPLPLSAVPGLGPKSCKRLGEMGLRKVGDLFRLKKGPLRAALGRGGAGLLERLRGQEVGAPLAVPLHRRSLSVERTFGRDIVDGEEARERLLDITDEACRRLREKELFASVVTLKLRYADFVTIDRARSLSAATDRNGPLRAAAAGLFTASWKRRLGVRLLGVKLSGLVAGARQLSLFDEEAAKKEGRVLQALDGLQRKHEGAIALGAGALSGADNLDG